MRILQCARQYKCEAFQIKNEMLKRATPLHVEKVIRTGSRAFGPNILPRPEQKNTLWMKKINCIFLLPGGLVKDSDAGTF